MAGADLLLARAVAELLLPGACPAGLFLLCAGLAKLLAALDSAGKLPVKLSTWLAAVPPGWLALAAAAAAELSSVGLPAVFWLQPAHKTAALQSAKAKTF